MPKRSVPRRVRCGSLPPPHPEDLHPRPLIPGISIHAQGRRNRFLRPCGKCTTESPVIWALHSGPTRWRTTPPASREATPAEYRSICRIHSRRGRNRSSARSPTPSISAAYGSPPRWRHPVHARIRHRRSRPPRYRFNPSGRKRRVRVPGPPGTESPRNRVLRPPFQRSVSRHRPLSANLP